MESVSNKNGSTKEEGELSDDDDTDEQDDSGRLLVSTHVHRDKKESVSKHSSSHSRRYEPGGRSGQRRRDPRRRADEQFRRIHRVATSDKHYRERQDSKQTSVSNTYTPSKFWANRRFRASSVRPLSPPRHSGSFKKLNSSYDVGQYGSQHQNNLAGGQEELEQLEREQERIRQQLRSLDEEASKNESPEETLLVVDSFGISVHSEDPESIKPLTDFSKRDRNETSEDISDEDLDVQELRRRALETSQRHLQLVASEPQSLQSGIASDDVVVIPDVEPDVPEPEIVMVEEEDEENLDISSSNLQAVLNSRGVIDGQKLRGELENKRGTLKSKIVQPTPREKRRKQRKKGEAHKDEVKQKSVEWIRQCEGLRILALDDPKSAFEKFLKLVNEGKGTDKPVVTGTIKDLKRQKQIPILSDKLAIQSLLQKQGDKKQSKDGKTKKAGQERRSVQLQDNYDEVEMDIDDSAAEDGDTLPKERVQPGKLVSSGEPVTQHTQTVKAVIGSFLPPCYSHMYGSEGYDSGHPVPPPPPSLPPLPPPPPPSEHQNSNGQPSLTHNRISTDSLPLHMFLPKRGNKENVPSEMDTNERLGQYVDKYIMRIRQQTEHLDVSHGFESESVSTSVEKSQRFHFDDDQYQRINAIPSNSPYDVERRSLIDYSASMFEDAEITHLERKNYAAEKFTRALDVFPSLSSHTEECPETGYGDHPYPIPSYERGREQFSATTTPPRLVSHDCSRRVMLLEEKSPHLRHYSNVLDECSPNPFDYDWPQKRIDSSKNLSQKRSVSPYSPPFPRRPALRGASKDSDKSSYSPYQRPDSRNLSREHLNDRSSFSPQPISRKHKFDFISRASVSPQNTLYRMYNKTSNMYEPEVPPNKRRRQSSPPPYIPTSIKFTSQPWSQFEASERGHSLSSYMKEEDEEEEDPVTLREKLLADIIEKRRTTLEILSNSNTPSVMSPKLSSVHSESSDASFMLERDLILSDHVQGGSALGVVEKTEEEEEEEEELQPPPALSRLVQRSKEIQPLSVLCKVKLLATQDHLHGKPQQPQYLKSHFHLGHSSMGIIKEIAGVRVDTFPESEGVKAYSSLITSQSDTSGKTKGNKVIDIWNNNRLSHPPGLSVQTSLLLDAVRASSEPPQLSKEQSISLPVSKSLETVREKDSETHHQPFSVTKNASLSCTIPDRSSPNGEFSAVESSSGQAAKPAKSSLTETAMPSNTSVERVSYPTPITSRLGPPARSGLESRPLSYSAATPILTNSAVKEPHVCSSRSALLTSSTNVSNVSTQLLTTTNLSPISTTSVVSTEPRHHIGELSLSRTSTASLTFFQSSSNVTQAVSVNNQSSIAKSSSASTAPKTAPARNVIISDVSRTSSPHSDGPSLTSSYSNHGPANTSSKRKYVTPLMLPLHPQVLVPVNSVSSSEDERDIPNEHNNLASVVESLSAGQEKNLSAEQLLHKQEQYLSICRQSILKYQESMKNLMKKSLKFTKGQHQEEKKKDQLKAQIMTLSEQMRVADRIAKHFQMQKNKTDEEVEMMKGKMRQVKKHYAERVKSVITLGQKLLGPAYVQKLIKTNVISASHLKGSGFGGKERNLPRAQQIALEKKKLMEKEKQIAEKLKKLKAAQTGKDLPDPIVKKTGLQPPNRVELQDVIKIDKNADPPGISAQHGRRKSLLEMNPSTTPNIPLTPRRSSVTSSAGKENVAGSLEPKPKSFDMDNNNSTSSSGHTTFKMPSGLQLTYLCKLQREKIEKYLQGLSPSSSGDVHIFSSLTGLKVTEHGGTALSSSSFLTLQNSKKKLKTSKTEASLAYTSPLLMFRSYRFNLYFRLQEGLGLQSSTYSNKLNPHCVICPYDLQGTCNDDSCQQQHPKDYKLSDHELLEDIVSCCPKLAGAPEGASPEEVKSCIVSYVDKVLNKHKDKMTMDELCVWLSAQTKETSGKRHPHIIGIEPRKWKPQSKDKTGFSLDLDHKLTRWAGEIINIERHKSVDKDAIISEEDVRYFAGDTNELLSLEANILKDKTNTQLWLRLASKKLNDPSKSPKECLDHTLNVLARGLEANQHDPDLWCRYLTLYKRHPEVKNFAQFCQTGLEYAPSYELWSLYLSSLTTYLEKDEASTQALEFLCKQLLKKGQETAPATNVSAANMPAHGMGSGSSDRTHGDKEELDPLQDEVLDETSVNVKNAIDLKDEHDVTKVGKAGVEKVKSDQEETKHAGVAAKNLGKGTEPSSSVDNLDVKLLSHQLLELTLLKAGLHLQTGRIKTALNFLQFALGLKKNMSFKLKVAELLTPADLLVLWLAYIHMLEWHQLPTCLFSVTNQNPGKLLAKDHITLHWASKSSLHTSVDTLVKLHQQAESLWESRGKDQEATCHYVQLVQSHIALLMSQHRPSEAVAACHSALASSGHVDLWLTLADVYASLEDVDGVKQVFREAILANRYSSRLHFYKNVYLYQKGETDLALQNLEQFVISHFDDQSQNLQHCDPNLLYSQLLRQDEAFNLDMTAMRKEVSADLHKDIYLWLCYSMLMELQGETAATVEIYERSLTYVRTPSDLVIVWQNYILYMLRSQTKPTDICDILIRSVISVPTKYQIPFSPSSSATWLDYRHSNRLLQTWQAVLGPKDAVDMLEMCIGFMPNNLELLIRAVDVCLHLKQTRRAYSWCQMLAAQADRPANLGFWRVAVALAQVEGTSKEVEQMLIGCVETMPLAVSGWKDFLLYEVSRENTAAIQMLLRNCQHLGLNIDGFVTTISASQ